MAEFNTPEFWPGEVFLDNDKAFYAAVGGGKVNSLSLTQLLNPFGKAIKNMSRASKTVKNHNIKVLALASLARLKQIASPPHTSFDAHSCSSRSASPPCSQAEIRTASCWVCRTAAALAVPCDESITIRQ